MSTARNIANYAGITGGLTGELKMWPVATAPNGYLLCDGSLVSRTTYSNLFAAIGTAFGAGNGTTTFQLPDYRDRMPIGAGNLYPAANTGGSKDAIVVSHTHTDSGHTHTSRDLGYGGGNGNFTGSSGSWSGNPNSTSNTSTGVANISSTGVSGTDANLPPYMSIHFIIRHL